MNDRILSLLGLCRRAGKIVIGADPVIESMREGKAFVVLTASDFSKNSKKNILKAIDEYGTKAYTVNRTKDEISHALGRLCGVLSITDKGFSDKIQELILKETEQEE
ncbi:MAG: ribosomal L7Ae/L30e/S12e/Gadd45 family protein [Ruminococcus sp.]|nr:ribosomal L7Ae/L30e/S12e/Gadd45 family protein [Ruminococcus sp.]